MNVIYIFSGIILCVKPGVQFHYMKNSSKSIMWTLGLLKTMKDPKYVVYSDHKIVMIKDVYPKAKHHYLVISEEEIPGIKEVKPKHAPLLEHMERKAREYVSKHAPDVEFK